MAVAFFTQGVQSILAEVIEGDSIEMGASADRGRPADERWGPVDIERKLMQPAFAG